MKFRVGLTTNSVATMSTILIVANSNATVATVVSSVVVSSVGIVAITTTSVTTISTNSNIAPAIATAAAVAVGCNATDVMCGQNFVAALI